MPLHLRGLGAGLATSANFAFNVFNGDILSMELSEDSPTPFVIWSFVMAAALSGYFLGGVG